VPGPDRRNGIAAISRQSQLLGAIVIATFATVMPGKAAAQDIGPESFRDTLVMRQLVFRAPCPDPVPKAWSLIDSTLARPPRCNLLEVAARAIAQHAQLRPQASPGDPWNPLGARVVVDTNTGSTGLPGVWLVLFDLAPDRPAWVVIDRQTGDIGVTLFGLEQARGRPRCLTR
jgi:hypothetical protein